MCGKRGDKPGFNIRLQELYTFMGVGVHLKRKEYDKYIRQSKSINNIYDVMYNYDHYYFSNIFLS